MNKTFELAVRRIVEREFSNLLGVQSQSESESQPKAEAVIIRRRRRRRVGSGAVTDPKTDGRLKANRDANK